MRLRLLLIPTLILAACSGSESADDPTDPTPDAGFTPEDAGTTPRDAGTAPHDAGTTASLWACSPDAERIAAREACVRDADCPCGTACTLGVCQAACATDDDCTDAVCGRFGTCVAEISRDAPRAIDRVADGVLHATPEYLVASDTLGVRPIVVTAQTRALDTVRVAASDGVEVKCPGGAFAAECLVEGVTVDERVEVEVQLTAPLADAEIRRVQIFAANQRAEVGVTSDAAVRSAIALDDDAPLAGIYTGHARRLGLAPLTLPISARLYDDGTNVVFEAEDPWRIFHPSGRLIGTATTGAAADLVTSAMRFPATLHDDGDFVPAATGALVIDETRTMEFFYDVGGAADVRWHFALERAGELPGGTAPVVPEDDPTPDIDSYVDALGDNWQTNSIARRYAFAEYLVSPESRLELCGPELFSTITIEATNVLFTGSAEGDGGSVGSSGNPLVDMFTGASRVNRTELRYESGAWGNGNDTGNAIPCAIEFERFQTTQSGHQIVFDPGTVDHCATLAEDTGCTVYATPSPRSIEIIYSGVQAPSGFAYPYVRDAAIVGVCRMDGALAKRCGEAVSCFERSGSDTLSSHLTAGALVPATGDLTCTAGGETLAFDADLTLDDAGTLFATCLEELTDAPDAPPANGDIAGSLTSWFPNRSCVEKTRELTAIEAFAQSAEGRPGAHRLLQRWLGLHAFLAREGAQRVHLPSAVVQTSPSDLDAREILELSVDAWEPVLGSMALVLADDDVLAMPDYRPWFDDTAPAATGTEELAQGLPVLVLDTIVAQVELAEAYLELSQTDLTGAGLRRMGRVLRYASEAESMAEAAYARMPNATWSADYLARRDSLRAAIGRVSAKLTALGTGDNLLGVAEDDLPLYFFGDEMTASQRFTAISDFLLGDSFNSLTAWAPQVVAQADTDLEDARTAFIAQSDRELQRTRDTRDQEILIQNLKQQYGDDLFNLCGAPSTLLGAQLLEEWETGQGRPFSPDDCYIDHADTTCTQSFDVEGPDYVSILRADDIAYQVCLLTEKRLAIFDVFPFVPFVVGGAPGQSTTLMSAGLCGRNGGTIAVEACGEDEICYSCTSDDETVTMQMTQAELMELGGGLDVPLKARTAARSACADRFPNARTTLPSLEDVPGVDLDVPACYRGALGEQALTLRALATEVEIARSELAELNDAYDIAIQSCLILQQGNVQIEDATAKHNETMTELREAKLAADIVANVAAGVKDCASSVGVSPFASGAACAGAATEAAALSVSDGMAFAMEEAQQKHDTLITQIENDISERTCFNEAELELVGARTAVLRIQQTMIELEAANLAFENMKVAAQGVWDDGHANLAFLEERFVTPMAHDYWLDERVTTYERSFRLAKRVTYLTVRAVEYELQQTLVDTSGESLRNLSLTAESPSDLEGVLQELYSFAGVRSINGNRPTDSKVVVSLRRHLMQLADGSSRPAGWQTLTEEERFQLLLSDSRYATFDDDGRYLGQQIPFTVSPLGTLGLGDAQGIGVLAANSCAERVWSVNASIVASGDFFVGDDPSFINVDLLKRNTFYSQWCSSRGREDAFQLASVRPSKNLFRDPSAGVAVGGTFLGVQNETAAYTRAQIEAVFNVSREDFSDDAYANGQTTQLAARGLYGEYALFLPAAIISETTGNTASSGLDLTKVEDILLRMDYVSVAR
ncbi:MAG: hypothetical protein RL846_38210 [Deltaproteobacteria bacterium]|jgi:hypothetical protein